MRVAAAIFASVALAFSIAGCGGSGGAGVEEPALRQCLADGGASVDSGAPATSLVPGAASADFRASVGTETMDITVEGSEEKARRAAADLEAALRTYGVAGAGPRLLQRENVIALFEREPSARARELVSGCVD